MKIKSYLIINSQNGDIRLLKNPTAGFGEYCVKLEINIPEPSIPSYTLNIPLPAKQEIKAETSVMQYGIPWALSEGIMCIKSVSPKGELQLDYTDDGLKRIFESAKSRKDEGWWGMRAWAEKNWGLPSGIYIEPARWEPLFENPLKDLLV